MYLFVDYTITALTLHVLGNSGCWDWGKDSFFGYYFTRIDNIPMLFTEDPVVVPRLEMLYTPS